MLKKALLMAAAAVSLSVLGCEDNPVDKYGDTLIRTYKGAQPAADAAEASLLATSVQTFRASNGRFPESLDELAAFSRISVDVSKYDYDPATGTVSLRASR